MKSVDREEKGKRVLKESRTVLGQCKTIERGRESGCAVKVERVDNQNRVYSFPPYKKTVT